MKPLLSVVIPTHNRARYAIHAIDSLLEISSIKLEIVVSDTSTDHELLSLLKNERAHYFNDARFRYVRPDRILDMTGNHNAAIESANGDYVCLIGDDDTISADALLAAEWAKANDVEVISPNVVANYVWPDFRSRFLGSKHASRLYFAKHMGSAIILNTDQALASALRNAGQGTDGLPKIYHGIVKKSTLEKIHKLSGAYFHGSSPDVSGAIGLSMCCKKFLVVDYPLTIPGASGGSNTGRSAMNTHKGKLDQESQTKSFETSGWTKGVPRFFSVETVWAHAALETVRHIAPHQVDSFNFARLIAICHVLHPEYTVEINQATIDVEQNYKISTETLRNKIKLEMIRYRREKLIRVVKRLMKPTAAGGRDYVGGLETIAAAPGVLHRHMTRLGLDWQKTVNKLK